MGHHLLSKKLFDVQYLTNYAIIDNLISKLLINVPNEAKEQIEKIREDLEIWKISSPSADKQKMLDTFHG